MDRLRFGGVIAATVMGGLAVVTAAGGPKPQPAPATMTFRCTAGDAGSPSCAVVSDLTDRIRDDGLPSPYVGGSIDTSGVFNVNFAPFSRVLNLYLGSRIEGLRPCGTTGNCHPLNLADTSLQLDNFDIKVKPLTANESQDLTGGLFAMTVCGAAYPALVDYTFWLPDGDGHWGLNFNPKAYPGTTSAVLVRQDNTNWTVEAMGDDVAELLSWGHSGITRHNGPSHEGFFHVRFKVAIKASSLPSGATPCH